MAIGTYAQLQSTIADFLNRDDLSVVIPSFIDLAEAQINREVRHWKMQAETNLTTPSGKAQLPADWLYTLEVNQIDTDTGAFKRNLRQFSDSEYSDIRYNTNDASGDPVGFRHSLDKIEILPNNGTQRIALRYVQKIPALSDTATTNWLLTDHPDVYLYGALLHAAPYLVEDARIQVWAQLYGAAVQNVNADSDKAKTSSSTLTMRNVGMNTGAYRTKHYQFRG
jgi:hypothetical protein